MLTYADAPSVLLRTAFHNGHIEAAFLAAKFVGADDALAFEAARAEALRDIDWNIAREQREQPLTGYGYSERQRRLGLWAARRAQTVEAANPYSPARQYEAEAIADARLTEAA